MAQTVVDAKVTRVPMAGIGYGDQSDELETLLGSCVGVALWDRSTKRGALAHVVLPDSRGEPAVPGKFADTAIASMRAELARQGANLPTTTAKLTGGATMFGKRTTSDIGQKNVDAVVAHLRQHKISVIARNLGGTKGRVVRFSLLDGSLKIYVGQELIETI